MSFLRNLFGGGPSVDVAQLIANGAIVLDVRSRAEYQSGHLKNAINIPLDVLPNQLNKLDKSKPIITCCASGMRSASAQNILRANGFTEVHNGGGWTSLQNKI